jgi:hypothetical protein
MVADGGEEVLTVILTATRTATLTATRPGDRQAIDNRSSGEPPRPPPPLEPSQGPGIKAWPRTPRARWPTVAEEQAALVAYLEERGHVERVPDPQDR